MPLPENSSRTANSSLHMTSRSWEGRSVLLHEHGNGHRAARPCLSTPDRPLEKVSEKLLATLKKKGYPAAAETFPALFSCCCHPCRTSACRQEACSPFPPRQAQPELSLKPQGSSLTSIPAIEGSGHGSPFLSPLDHPHGLVRALLPDGTSALLSGIYTRRPAPPGCGLCRLGNYGHLPGAAPIDRALHQPAHGRLGMPPGRPWPAGNGGGLPHPDPEQSVQHPPPGISRISSSRYGMVMPEPGRPDHSQGMGKRLHGGRSSGLSRRCSG